MKPVTGERFGGHPLQDDRRPDICQPVVEIEPAAAPVKLVRKGRFLVAVAEGDGDPLTLEDVERLRGEIERERGRS